LVFASWSKLQPRKSRQPTIAVVPNGTLGRRRDLKRTPDLVSPRAQARTITGVIADKSGAVIPDIQITLSGPAGLSWTSTSDGQGRYTFQGLLTGEYRLKIAAEGFASYETTGLQVASSAVLTHNVVLVVAATTQEVTVADTMQLDVEPANNASALVLKGADLTALSDDPDDLTEDLQALAGPAAGPNGGEIFVDGFSGGKLPPKSAIREVRVNQNPPSMTAWGLDGSRFLPSQAPTGSAVRLCSISGTLRLTPGIRFFSISPTTSGE